MDRGNMNKDKSKKCPICGRVIAIGYPSFKHLEYHLKRDEAEMAFDENNKPIGYRRKMKGPGPLFSDDEVKP